MRAILLGCPGAGKGTQAQYLSKHYKIPIIATGDMLRNAIHSGSGVGEQIKQIMNAGNLVPDNIIIKIVQKRIQEDDCKNGYLLDGFPRTITQAEALSNARINLDYVLEIYAPNEEIVTRLSGRRLHQPSGRVYHIKYNPPKKPNTDDITGEPLIQRKDDQEKTVRNRLQVYHEQTEPLVQYYRNLYETQKHKPSPKYIRIDGTGTIEQVQKQIFSSIQEDT